MIRLLICISFGVSLWGSASASPDIQGTTVPAGQSFVAGDPQSVISNADYTVTQTQDGQIVIQPDAAHANYIYRVAASAPENSLIQLPQGQRVVITAGVGTFIYTAISTDATVAVRKVMGKPALEVAKGRTYLQLSAKGNYLPLAVRDNDHVAVAAIQTIAARMEIERDDTGVRAFLENGFVRFGAISRYQEDYITSTHDFYPGENVRLGSDGYLDELRIGSIDGNKNLPGDSLPNVPGLSGNIKSPRLNGNLARLGNSQSMLDLVKNRMIKMLGDPNVRIDYDTSTAVISVTSMGRTYRYMAVGNANIQLNGVNGSGGQQFASAFAATNPADSASGSFTIADQGIQIGLNGVIGYFADFRQAVQSIDPQGSAVMQSNGTLEIQVSGKRFIAIPGIQAAPSRQPNPTPGFEDVGNGFLAFRDRTGSLQTLYPILLDPVQANAVIQSIDPAASLAYTGAGAYVLTLGGMNYKLIPDYEVVANPWQWSNIPYWDDGNTTYVSFGSWAQGTKMH